MTYQRTRLRRRQNLITKDKRMFFVLEADLKHDLSEIARANYVSESQFVRESVRRCINEYKKAYAQ